MGVVAFVVTCSISPAVGIKFDLDRIIQLLKNYEHIAAGMGTNGVTVQK